MLYIVIYDLVDQCVFLFELQFLVVGINSSFTDNCRVVLVSSTILVLVLL